METTTVKKHQNIKGWGMDANPENEPTYPIKNYTGDDHKRLSYKKPAQQKSNIEILKSNERLGVSAVYGTSVPPSGLSGMIRRFAFRYSEGSFGHWLPLLLADRVNVIEGIVSDIARGNVPNIFAELGGKAEWKYNKRGLAKKVAVGIIITAAVYALLSRKKKLSKV